jgi:type 1 glutamine amidotransferase
MTDAATTTATGRPLAVVVLVGEAEHGDPWHALDQTGRRVAEVIADELGEAVSVRLARTSDDAETLLDGADVAVLDVSGDLAEPETDSSALVDALSAHLAAGRGLVALHSSALAFRDDPRWAALLGGRWVPGVTMHPQIGHALVQTSGVAGAPPESDFVLYDERYTHLETAEGVEVLAFHTEDGIAHPLVWRAEVPGRGRVAYDALGHGVESFDSAEHRALLAALVRWVAS